VDHGRAAIFFDNTRIPLQVTIREVATGIVQESKSSGMTVYASGFGSGGTGG
jgi:hypothetical protein